MRWLVAMLTSRVALPKGKTHHLLRAGDPLFRSWDRSNGAAQVPEGIGPAVLYGSNDDKVRVRVLLRDETIWLNLSQLAELFDVGVPAISKHLKNTYETGELERVATVSKMETVQTEGDR